MGVLPDWMIKRDVKIEPFTVHDKKEQVGKVSFGTTGYGYDARCGYRWKVFNVISGTIIDPKNFDPKALWEVDLTPNPKHDWELTDERLEGNPNKLYNCKLCSQKAFVCSIPNDYKMTYCGGSPKPDHIIIPPHSFALGETMETFNIPRDMICIVVGKSTYARCGIIVNVTPGEPEWIGKWTVEISNTTPLPAKIYCGEGIMQCIFLRTDGVSEALLNAVRRLADRASDPARGCVPEMPLETIEELLHRELGHSTCEVSYADKKGKYQNQDGLTLPTVDKKV